MIRELKYLAVGLLLGFGAYYGYDFRRSVEQQIEIAGVQGKVDAALTICPAAFANVVKTEPKKEK